MKKLFVLSIVILMASLNVNATYMLNVQEQPITSGNSALFVAAMVLTFLSSYTFRKILQPNDLSSVLADVLSFVLLAFSIIFIATASAKGASNSFGMIILGGTSFLMGYLIRKRLVMTQKFFRMFHAVKQKFLTT